MRTFVMLPFNRSDRNREDGGWRYNKTIARREWWEERAVVMEKFTLPSLLAQTNMAFHVVVPIIEDVLGLADPVIDVLRKFEKRLPIDIWSTHACHEEGLLEPQAYFAQYHTEEDCLIIRLDSDDMYAKHAVETFKQQKMQDGACFYLQKGWIVDQDCKRYASYDATGTPPPFYAVYFPRSAMRTPYDHQVYKDTWKLNTFHHRMHKAKRAWPLPDGLFCYVLHGANTSSSWQNHHTNKHVGKIYEDAEGCARLLERFGVSA